MGGPREKPGDRGQSCQGPGQGRFLAMSTFLPQEPLGWAWRRRLLVAAPEEAGSGGARGCTGWPGAPAASVLNCRGSGSVSELEDLWRGAVCLCGFLTFSFPGLVCAGLEEGWAPLVPAALLRLDPLTHFQHRPHLVTHVMSSHTLGVARSPSQ